MNATRWSDRKQAWRWLLITVVLGSCLVRGETARAGIGPENVIVVVNADSVDSRTIANHYTELRNVPSINVIFLKEIPEGMTISLEQFKSRILLPVLEQINARKLAPQAKVIAYSAGFPTSVNISEHTSRLTDPNQKKYQLPTASLTGLTYFYQFMLADNEKYLDFGANLYARGPFERHFVNPYFDPEKRKRFDEAIADRDAGQFEPAGSALEKLFEETPTVAPLAILAAEARMQGGDPDSATRLVEQAIAAGWSSGTYLDESEVLSPLLKTARLGNLRSSLANYPAVSQEPIGFTSSVGWTACGSPGASLQEGVPYLMACMLAVIHPRGSTVEQATQVLRTASQCDSTFPTGSFWFTFTGDDRTNPRFPQLGNALLWLKKEGHDAEIIHAAMPTSKSGPCAGLMLGTADIPLDGRKWEFVPGAISENLTSFSAHFETNSQTKITALLHAGAAMTCGPVFEPYNLPYKFPSPMMYAFYASGAAAIESFYLSVTSPYQTLIVGDPMAQPFSRSPTDWVGTKADPAESGKRRIQFTRRALPLGERGAEARIVEIYVEGKLVQVTPAVSRIEMSLPEQITGTLEVRSVLVGGGSLQPRASHSEWLPLGDKSRHPVASWVPEQQAVQLRCDGATSIELLHHHERVGSVQGETGQISLGEQALGSGPIRLRPIAVLDGQQVPGEAIIVQN